MTRTFYDLSDCLSNSTSSFEFNKHEIAYRDPSDTVEESAAWGLGPEYWPGGVALAAETVTLSTHSGTHVDAPLHYGPAESGHTRSIDEVPLEWCFGDGVLLDFRGHDRVRGITRPDVEAALLRIGHTLKPLDIVLVMTGTDLRVPGYESRHAGLRADATEFLVDSGVKLIGIDAWGLDRPFDIMIEDARAGRSQFWETHLLGRRKEYCQIERLANLETLPRATGFTVCAFPCKLERASAGWSRVVAIFES
jgi:kynurenine formamidase